MGKNYETLRDLYGSNHDFVLITLELSEAWLNSNLGLMHSSEIHVRESLPFGLGIFHFPVQSELRLWKRDTWIWHLVDATCVVVLAKGLLPLHCRMTPRVWESLCHPFELRVTLRGWTGFFSKPKGLIQPEAHVFHLLFLIQTILMQTCVGGKVEQCK